MTEADISTHGLRVPLGADMFHRVEDDLEQSILMIITTLPQTRELEPNYGCDLRSFLFRPITPELLSQMRYIITEALQQWEHRLEKHVQVEVEPRMEEAQLLIRVNYQYQKLNRTIVIEWDGGAFTGSRRIGS